MRVVDGCRIAVVALVGLVSAGGAHAQMSPATYSGPIGDRLMAEFRCVGTSVGDRGVVLPGFFGVKGALAAGQYRNPTTCAVEGSAR
jgi:hypothetical protein